MRVVCPSCGTAYAVPDAAVATHRVMRCSRCAHEFAPPRAAGDMAQAIHAAPVHEPPAPQVLAEATVAVSRALKTQVLAAWGASLLVLLMLAGAGVAWRRPVMHAWPASARFYAAMGFLE